MGIETQIEQETSELLRHQAVLDIKNLFSKYDRFENIGRIFTLEKEEENPSSFKILIRMSFGQKREFVFEKDDYSHQLIYNELLPGIGEPQPIKVTAQESGLNAVQIRDYLMGIARDPFTKKF